MKIITNDAVYVQKKDLAYLKRFQIAVPWSLYIKIFFVSYLFLEEKALRKFVKFNLPEEIEFFKNLDWVIDYDEIKDMSDEDIMILGGKINEDRLNLIKRIEKLTAVEKAEELNLKKQLYFLEIKMCSLKNILLLKRGNITMEFPLNMDCSLEQVPKKNIRNFARFLVKKD